MTPPFRRVRGRDAPTRVVVDRASRLGGVVPAASLQGRISLFSGAGHDGTAGLRAIKEQGGVTIAQLPDSASYDGMPRAAIATGLVDYVLSPEELYAKVEGTLALEGTAILLQGGMLAVTLLVLALLEYLRQAPGEGVLKKDIDTEHLPEQGITSGQLQFGLVRVLDKLHPLRVQAGGQQSLQRRFQFVPV